MTRLAFQLDTIYDQCELYEIHKHQQLLHRFSTNQFFEVIS